MILFTPAFGWTTSENSNISCIYYWYSLVEKKVLIGDGSGHGPDLGSDEWRSAVEYKLGIRDNPEVPPRDTDQWCEYINTYYIKPAQN